jgi:CRISPR-associated protein Cmr2
MISDYYAFLSENNACQKCINKGALTSGLIDECLVLSFREKQSDRTTPDPKNEARQCYMKLAGNISEEDLTLPDELDLKFQELPISTWFGIDVEFELITPWYSRDDRPFHILDNPVHKDRIFGVPYMSATSWKGLLRWSYEMKKRSIGLEAESDKIKLKDKKDVICLFGNERSAQKEFRSGTLIFYPTWFNKIGFEVINPHSRTRRAGTQPIYYEVVPAGTKGNLRLLFTPMPGELERDKIAPADFVDGLIDSINMLLETYGISAKRTVGWGAAKILKWTGYPGEFTPNPNNDSEGFKKMLKSRIPRKGGV